MNDSIERKRGAILSYVSIIISTIVQLLYTPLLIRMLGQSEYGLYSLVSSIIGYLTVLDLGFGNAIIVYTAKYREQKKYKEEQKLHGMFFAIFCIIGLIAGSLGLVLFFSSTSLFGDTMTNIELIKMKIMLLILSFNLAITFPFSIFSSIISAYEQFTFQKIMSILNTILKPLLMIPLLFLGYRSITMCIVITCANIFVLISNYIYCKKKIKLKIKFQGFDKKLFITIFSYSFFICLGVIVDKINWSLDQFILGAVSGTIAVSVYAVASQLNQLFVNLSTAISSVLLPKMSKMVAKNASPDELTNEMIKVGRMQCFVIFLMVSGLVLFGKEFIMWWAGNNFEEAYYIALILIIPLSIPLIQNLGLSIMQAKNMHKFRAVLLVFIAILNIVVSIPLAKLYDGIGSAIGTSISLILGNIIIMNIYYYKKVKINIFKFWKEIVKLILPLIIPIIIILIVMNLYGYNSFINIIIYALLYTIIYTIIAYNFSMNNYEKKLVINTLKKLKLLRG